MQKGKNNRKTVGLHSLSVFIIGIISIVSLTGSKDVIRKKTVTFTSGDSLKVTADEYITAGDKAYVVLFHGQGSSRGEFQDIAPRLCKMDYNCLAVDLRNGGNRNFVSNQTVKRCRAVRCRDGANDIQLDMEAAVDYAYDQSGQPVVLLGSGANGSLSLKVANENANVKAVVAFSPGEYFLPEIRIQDTISTLKKPAFITSSLTEYPYVAELASGIDEQYLTLFEPQTGEGSRGTAALEAGNENNSEYWLALLLFFKDLL